MCRVGFGVATNAAFNVSSCLALMVVRGPRRLVPEFCSSFSILFVSLSEDVELSVSLMSSCIGSCRSGDKLLSVHDDTGNKQEEEGGSSCGNVREEEDEDEDGDLVWFILIYKDNWKTYKFGISHLNFSNF